MINLKRLIAKSDWRTANSVKHSGVTLLELLIATGIAAIVITSVMGTIGNIYFTQKKVRFTQNFYAESRILMERVAQFARNNTIDYDRYFIESGPGFSNCSSFATTQIPSSASTDNTLSNRKLLGYPNIFYWDTTGDLKQDRNLGGAKLDGTDDGCAEAFDGVQETLYLINGSRTLRTAIRNKDDYDILTDPTEDANKDYRIEVQRQLGADTDNDLVADIWGPYDANGDGDYIDYGSGDVSVLWDTSGSGKCVLKHTDGTTKTKILGDETSADFCQKAHKWTPISPKPIKINRMEFIPSPSRDPFLNFRVSTAQVHPHVFINMETDLRDPTANGFEVGFQPTLSFQTAVSSRVFGNTR